MDALADEVQSADSMGRMARKLQKNLRRQLEGWTKTVPEKSRIYEIECKNRRKNLGKREEKTTIFKNMKLVKIPIDSDYRFS